MIWVNILVVLALILAEAIFAGAEMALVSIRESKAKALAESSKRGRRVASLVADPNRFLSAVQIGITLTSLLASAFGAVTLSRSASAGLRQLGVGHDLASVIGFLGVTLLISYVTLVIGELAPKRIGLQRSEGAALLLGPLLDRIASLSRPAIWALSKSTDAVVRLLGGDPDVRREPMTEQELRDMVTAHESLSRDERALIDEVFTAGDRPVREVMVPRTEVEFIDTSMPLPQALKVTEELSHSRFPVVRGSHDDVAGFVHVRDLVRQNGARRGLRVSDVTRPVAQLPATRRVLPAMSDLRREGQHLAVVVDEYGGTAGIVTLEDLIEELVGEIRDEYDVGEDSSRLLSGGDVEVDGLLNLDEFAEQTGLSLPAGPYETAAGFLMAALGRLPRKGDAVEAAGARLSVTEMDGRRVDRIRVTSLGPADAEPAEPVAEPV